MVLLAYTMAYHTNPTEEPAMILIHLVPQKPAVPTPLPDVRSPGYAFDRGGATAMVYTVRRHRRERMLLLAATYGGPSRIILQQAA